MKKIICADREFFVEKEADIRVTLKQQTENVQVFHLEINSEKPIGNVEMIIPFEMKGVLSTYAPTSVFKRNRMVMQWFAPTSSQSNFSFGTPFLSVVNRGNINFATLALSDAVNDNEIQFYVQDFKQEGNVEFKIKLLTGREKFTHYAVDLRIDDGKQEIANAIQELTKWFKEYYPNNLNVSDVCYEPLYSSWYNFHQHPNSALLEKELILAKELGFGSLIIDDGWQYDGNGTSDYIDCGDWKISEEKFPDFKGFVEKAHALGIKVLLWFPLPFVGFNTKAYQKFKDKLLYEEGNTTNAGILDPRYKEVREFITDCIVDIFKKYNLDGLKLDFTDSFFIKEETPKANEKMDIHSLSDAIQQLLNDINDKVLFINKDAAIEYRQNYVGPAITQYGNMLRVGDCAFDSITNRIAINDMRLLNYRLAIHSDMLYWGVNETNENVATQLNNVLFSVPQISVLLTEDTKEHIQVLKNYVAYWQENRNTLMHGEFHVFGMDSNYTMAYAEDEEKRIIASYVNGVIKSDNKPLDIFNASNSEGIIIESEDKKLAKSYNCLGELVEEREINVGINKIQLPLGGRVEVR